MLKLETLPKVMVSAEDGTTKLITKTYLVI